MGASQGLIWYYWGLIGLVFIRGINRLNGDEVLGLNRNDRV